MPAVKPPVSLALRRHALRAAQAAREARDARRERARSRVVALGDVKRRLEMLLAAVYGRPLVLDAAAAPEPLAPLMRVWEARSRHLRPADPRASAIGDRILLPPSLPAGANTVARYRLLAIEQAERLARGTFDHLPDDAAPALERDLYLLCEAAAVDRALVRRIGGTAGVLRAARADALAARPPMGRLRAAEREPELMLRRLLEADPAEPPAELPRTATPDESAAWARRQAALAPRTRRPYRGLAPVDVWGAAPDAPTLAGRLLSHHEQVIGSGGVFSPITRATLGGSDALPDGVEPPPDVVQSKDADLLDQPPNEAGSPSDDPGLDPGGDAAGRGRAARVDARVDMIDVDPEIDPVTGRRLPPGIDYPEWDHHAGAYRPRGATVRPGEPSEDDGDWAATVLATHRPLVHQVRERFERLRARRIRLGRQRDGEDLDLRACVDALVARRARLTVDDRLYASTRATRRGLAIALLVDVSGSTEAPVSAEHRIVDVERVAVLLASEAFEALGDLYTVLAFSGIGAHNVRVTTLKAFGERNGPAVRRRVSAVKPDGNTRLGAAIRHATALLATQPAGHRLLIVLSDGRPNDMGGYQGDTAVEDSRRAVIEARASGVRPFCLTVDREATEYLARIFGPTGHTMVTHPDHVPNALLALVRQLLTT